MPRLTPAEYLAQKKNGTTTKNLQPRAGFDAAKFQERKQMRQSQTLPSGNIDTSPIQRKEQTVGTRAADVLGGATYGFSGVGRGIQGLLSKGVEKLTGVKGFGAPTTREGFEKATGTDLDTRSGKVGEFVGEVAQYATPGGLAFKPAQMAFQAGVAGATEALSTQSVDKGTAFTAGTAALLPPAANLALKTVSTLFKNVAKGTAGVVGGKGTKVIEEIYKNPQAAREGMRGLVSISDDAAKVRAGVSNIAKKASDEFADDLANLPKRLGRSPKVLTDKTKTTIKVDGKTYQLSKQGVKSQLTQALRQFDVAVDPKKKAFDFSEAPLDTAESKRLKEIFTVIDQWTDTTPVGFHKLSRKVGNYRKPGEQSKELNAIIDSVTRNINGYVGKRIPAAKEMLKKYSTAQDIIEAFNQELATGGRFVGGTAERIKTEKKVANLLTGEKTSANQMLAEQLPQGEDVIARQAGRLMVEQVPRNASSIGDLLRGAISTVISPKMVGETSALLGITVPKAQRLLQRLSALDPATRAFMAETIADLMETEALEESQLPEVQ
jgi:hypothetical protein